FVGQRGDQLSHHAQPVEVREIRLQLAKSLMLVLRAFALRDIDMRSDHLDELSIAGEERITGRFNIFDRSVGKRDPEFECETSLLPQRLVGLLADPVAIFCMYPLQHGLPAREPLQRIKSPGSVTLL